MFIDLQTPLHKVESFLHQIEFFSNKNEKITEITKPGEGNMNVVLRVKTNLRSFILKQSRPFVQKYKEIKAPIERIEVEHQFYKAIANNTSLNQHIPQVLKFNKEHHLLILEDLGKCEDMTSLYSSYKIERNQLKLLVNIVSNIHKTKVANKYPENKELRKLNHQHIFELPFLENNGFSLNNVQEGLEKLSIPYKKDELLKEKIKKIGDKYLSEGTTLIHGDFYPGSWMSKQENIYIIDPEFSFLGFAEFDLGVLAAHFILISKNKAVINTIEDFYPTTIESALLAQVTGIEIMRRLIGLAQLPIKLTLQEKENLLQLAYQLIMS